ncbi:MAG: RNA polymerase sigma-70 factor [Chitinophagaceae bacterium]|nr:RNA polymerase sigma-70 factor [Chitinophagaceae bacterium]
MLKVNDLHQEKNSYYEKHLLPLLAKGDENAFRMIYDHHKGRTYRVALKYLKSAEIAKEVVQEVFMKLWQNREVIRPDLPVEAWLVRVTMNNTLNRLKKLANEWKALDYLKNTQDVFDDSLQQKLSESDYQTLLNGALRSLSDKQLLVYQLAKDKNLSYFEIAEHLNISPLTVKTHMSRALSNIKLYLNMHWNIVILLVHILALL